MNIMYSNFKEIDTFAGGMVVCLLKRPYCSMKRKLLIPVILCLFLLSGCGTSNTDSPEPETPAGNAVSFTDDLGRTVTVRDPQRTAALLGSFAEIWQLAGGEVTAAPDDAWDDLTLELDAETVNLGNTKNLSLEQLFAAEPDFILASTNTRINMEWLETLENTGIPTAYFDVSDFEDYLRILKICTEITGREDLYEQNGLAIQERIDAVLEHSSVRVSEDGAPTVLCLRVSASAVYVKNSSGNVLGEMLCSLGCDNIADGNDALLENLSLEYILSRDPEYIFVVQSGDDYDGMIRNFESFTEQNPAWQQLSAVQNGRVFFMEKRLYGLKPNALWGQAYEDLEEILQNF